MTSMLFWDVTHRSLVSIDISGKSIGSIFKGPAVGPTGCPETSVTNNHSALRNITKEQRSHLQPGEDLKSRKETLKQCICIHEPPIHWQIQCLSINSHLREQQDKQLY